MQIFGSRLTQEMRVSLREIIQHLLTTVDTAKQTRYTYLSIGSAF